MEISQEILEGNYSTCYNSIFQNLKSEADQQQFKQFMNFSQLQCVETFQIRFREYEQAIASQYDPPRTCSEETQLMNLSRVNQILTELNRILSEKLQTSLLFGSIMYSLGDFRLKQERAKIVYLQQNLDEQRLNNKKRQQENKCFANMCKTKDLFILQLKSRISILQDSLKQYTQQNCDDGVEEIFYDPLPTLLYKNGSSTGSSSKGSDMYTYSFGNFIKSIQEKPTLSIERYTFKHEQGKEFKDLAQKQTELDGSDDQCKKKPIISIFRSSDKDDLNEQQNELKLLNNPFLQSALNKRMKREITAKMDTDTLLSIDLQSPKKLRLARQNSIDLQQSGLKVSLQESTVDNYHGGTGNKILELQKMPIPLKGDEPKNK